MERPLAGGNKTKHAMDKGGKTEIQGDGDRRFRKHDESVHRRFERR